jgi:hypothetical protein
VRWDGHISFCGFDIWGQTELNANEHSLKTLWNSPQFWIWRDAQLAGDRKILYCKACPDWSCQRRIIIEREEEDMQIIQSPITEYYSRQKKVERFMRFFKTMKTMIKS